MTRVLAGLVLLVSMGLLRAIARTEIADASQPQLGVADDGTVWLAYGRGGSVLVSRSSNGGETFGAAAVVADLPKLRLGMRRGPRIAAHGDAVTVTAIGEDLIAFSSRDGGKTWTGPVTVNEAPSSAREGLHDLAIAPDGRLFATWLDLRSGAMQLWGAESTDAGRTWTRNAEVYHSPDKSICECCHPSALFDAEGNLAVMWRNSISGSRDLWMATRARGALQFSAAKKIGTGTWKLDACPMDGGRIIALGGGKFASVWQRAGEVYYSTVDGPEVLLGKGKQPVAMVRGGTTIVLWQDGADLVSASVAAGTVSPAKRATNARFPVIVPLAGGRGGLLAYEKGPSAGNGVTDIHAMHSGGTHTGGKVAPSTVSAIVVERL